MHRLVQRQSASAGIFVLVLSLLTISGCMVGPQYVQPQTTVPAEWAGIPKEPTGQKFVVTAGDADLIRWWLQFNDPIMTALVEESLKANLDLKNAEARLRQARASRGVAVGGLWPSAGASGSYQRLHKAGASNDQDLFQTGLDALWELDFFGGHRRNLESSNAALEAATEDIRDVQVSLVAEVALNYIQLRGYQQEILIAHNNLKAQQQTAEITRKRFSVGFASALDVANADATAASTEAQIPVYETAERQTIYALSVLLARPPADLVNQLDRKSVV